jgi:DNA-binding transcriptional regulator YiaG
MPKIINREKDAKKAPKIIARSTIANLKPSEATTVNSLRTHLAVTQTQFARLLAVSVRSLATLESGVTPTEPVARRLTELERLTAGLSEVIKKESLGKWLQTPNQAFDGLKPLEVIERGESDRLWEMIYFLRSGVPT